MRRVRTKARPEVAVPPQRSNKRRRRAEHELLGAGEAHAPRAARRAEQRLAKCPAVAREVVGLVCRRRCACRVEPREVAAAAAAAVVAADAVVAVAAVANAAAQRAAATGSRAPRRRPQPSHCRGRHRSWTRRRRRRPGARRCTGPGPGAAPPTCGHAQLPRRRRSRMLPTRHRAVPSRPKAGSFPHLCRCKYTKDTRGRSEPSSKPRVCCRGCPWPVAAPGCQRRARG